MTEKMIRDAYCRIRTIDQTIPDDVLDFMKDAALEKLRKHAVSGSVVLVSDILTETQINRALIYYTKHKEYVDNMAKITQNSFEPSQIEDKNDPMLWKAEYWKWFLTTDR